MGNLYLVSSLAPYISRRILVSRATSSNPPCIGCKHTLGFIPLVKMEEIVADMMDAQLSACLEKEIPAMRHSLSSGVKVALIEGMRKIFQNS